MRFKIKQFSVLPGFGITLGFAILYLSLIVLVPLSALFWRSASLGFAEFWRITTDARVLASYRLTFGAAFASAVANAVLGFIVAWTLVRYSFPGKKLVDALVDLPFALPTAVSGIAITALCVKSGWVGRYFEPFGIRLAFTPLGITLVMTFIGLPFVVRTLQPAIEELEAESEEAAASLGANRWQTFWRVLFPSLVPALLTGFALALARAIGEYGSVVFIAGNMPMKTEISSLLIITKLEQYDIAGATAIAAVMLLASFVILLAINLLQYWTNRGQWKGV